MGAFLLVRVQVVFRSLCGRVMRGRGGRDKEMEVRRGFAEEFEGSGGVAHEGAKESMLRVSYSNAHDGGGAAGFLVGRPAGPA